MRLLTEESHKPFRMSRLRTVPVFVPKIGPLRLAAMEGEQITLALSHS
jgi:hypothetical protein